MTKPQQVEIEELRERVRQLEEVVGISARKPRPCGLTPNEHAILSHLSRLPMGTKRGLMFALYGHLPNGGPDETILNVYICRIRRRLRPLGVEITTVWGEGWRLPAESKDKIKHLFENKESDNEEACTG